MILCNFFEGVVRVPNLPSGLTTLMYLEGYLYQKCAAAEPPGLQGSSIFWPYFFHQDKQPARITHRVPRIGQEVRKG